MKVTIQKFDVSGFKNHRIILVVGKRGTGKSTLLRDLLGHLASRVEFGMAMTPTEESAEMFRGVMPAQWVHPCFDPMRVESMLNIQRECARKHKIRDLFLVMDDCMYDKKVLKGLCMRDLFMNGRHLHITYCNAMQYVMDMGPDLRTQVDYVFALRENIHSNKTKLWKYFFGMFSTYADFNKVMEKCTEDHSALVLDNTAKTNDIESCVFWYKAAYPPPPVRMGAPRFWDASTRCVRSEREKEALRDNETEDTQKDTRIMQVDKKDK